MWEPLNYSRSKRIPITDYLTSLGIEPVRVRGNEYWYDSPFREDITRSLKVNKKTNLWYDRGVGKGGTILDLGVEIHHCTIRSFIYRLEEGKFVPMPVQILPPNNPEPKILSFGDIKDRRLVKYLKGKCIDLKIARRYCAEAEFQVRAKNHKALAFPNSSGGFELRNKWFKGSSSPKDCSFRYDGSNKICVLEGFMDFLSVMQIREKRFRLLTEKSSFLVLNSPGFLNKAIPSLKGFSEINLFLDDDPAGMEARNKIEAAGIAFKDASTLFPYHKNVNEYLWDFQRRKKAAIKRNKLRK